MVVKMSTKALLIPFDFTSVAIMPVSHGPSGLPCILGGAQTTGDQVHAEGSLAGIVSL